MFRFRTSCFCYYQTSFIIKRSCFFSFTPMVNGLVIYNVIYICIYIYTHIYVYVYINIVWLWHLLVNLYIYIYKYIEFLEVGIVSWPAWDLNPRPPNSDFESQLFTATPISSLCSVFTFHFGLCLRQSPHLL